MNKILTICLAAIFTVLNANATYWICTTSRNVNMREEATSEGNVPICNIPKGDYVVIDDETYENGYVYAVWVNEDIYGYVYSKYLTKIQELETTEGDILQETGYISQYEPELEIENQCDRRITVSLNGSPFQFDAGETQRFTLPAGKVSIFASLPGVIPFSTSQYVESNHSYKWEFFIKHEYRRR